MREVESSTSFNAAKVIIFSVIGTLLVITALTYLFRTEIKTFIFNSIRADISHLMPDTSQLNSEEDRVIKAIEKVNPAVVSVVITKDVPVYEQYFETVNPWGLFGGFSIPRVRENGTEEREVGGGSGFIVSSDGLIVTNRHVVEDPEARYSVVLADGTFYEVEVVDLDPQLDVAILKISELIDSKLPYVQFGSSESLKLGQSVIAIGNALAEFHNSVSLGIVSGLGRSITASDRAGNSEQLNHVIQTDAAINPGNSGGPLLNLNGEVIGVNVATSQGADNVGFALPAYIVEQVVNSVRQYGEIIRPFLGVRYVMITDEIKDRYELSVSYGAYIIEDSDEGVAVNPNSPASRADIQSGDIIMSVDGVSLINRDLATELRNKSVGEEISLTLLRNGNEEIIDVTLDKEL